MTSACIRCGEGAPDLETALRLCPACGQIQPRPETDGLRRLESRCDANLYLQGREALWECREHLGPARREWLLARLYAEDPVPGLVPVMGYAHEEISSPQASLLHLQLPAQAFSGQDLDSLMRAQGLRVSYPVPLPGLRGWFRRGSFVALEGADFAIPSGGTLGVVGESGSGKSTLALAALGLLPHSGDLHIGDTGWEQARQTGAEKALRRQVQVVFQDPFSSLSPRMTVEQIVGEGLVVHEPALDAAQRRERVRAALADVGLVSEPSQADDWLQRYPHEFSGGQRQRLAIARALIVEPQLLVLDEPTSALDVTVQQQVLTLLQRLQRERGLSYLLITHDIAVIRAMAHEVLVLKDGVVMERGPVEQVLRAPNNAYTQALVRAAS